MSVPAVKVKELRDRSGAGFSLCKEALQNCDGDIEVAAEWLHARGAQIAEKKAGRQTSEGIVAFASSGNKGALVEILTETDFVANNEQLRDFAAFVAQASASAKDGISLAEISHEGRVVEEARQEISAKTGENIQFGHSRVLKASNSLHHYVHHNAKIGVMADIDSPEGSQVGKDVCMQVAAMRPDVVTSSDFDESHLASVRESFEREVAQGGKNPDVQEKIVTGKLSKYVSERALLMQDFIKDDKVKVEQYLKDNNATVSSFTALYLG